MIENDLNYNSDTLSFYKFKTIELAPGLYVLDSFAIQTFVKHIEKDQLSLYRAELIFYSNSSDIEDEIENAEQHLGNILHLNVIGQPSKLNGKEYKSWCFFNNFDTEEKAQKTLLIFKNGLIKIVEDFYKKQQVIAGPVKKIVNASPIYGYAVVRDNNDMLDIAKYYLVPSNDRALIESMNFATNATLPAGLFELSDRSVYSVQEYKEQKIFDASSVDLSWLKNSYTQRIKYDLEEIEQLYPEIVSNVQSEGTTVDTFYIIDETKKERKVPILLFKTVEYSGICRRGWLVKASMYIPDAIFRRSHVKVNFLRDYLLERYGTILTGYDIDKVNGKNMRILNISLENQNTNGADDLYKESVNDILGYINKGLATNREEEI